MMYILLDVVMFLLVSISWSAIVFIIGYPLKRLFKQLKDLTTDTIILALLYLLNPLSVFDPSFDGFYDVSVLWASAVYLPVAFAVLYWVNQGED